MKKGNVVELGSYRKRDKEEEPPASSRSITEPSKELQLAIKRLIQRMRKRGPMRRVRRANSQV